MLMLFTTPMCVRCRKAKEVLEEKNIPYKEYNVASDPKALELAKEYGVTMGGTIIDPETKETIQLEDL